MPIIGAGPGLEVQPHQLDRVGAGAGQPLARAGVRAEAEDPDHVPGVVDGLRGAAPAPGRRRRAATEASGTTRAVTASSTASTRTRRSPRHGRRREVVAVIRSPSGASERRRS